MPVDELSTEPVVGRGSVVLVLVLPAAAVVVASLVDPAVDPVIVVWVMPAVKVATVV